MIYLYIIIHKKTRHSYIIQHTVTQGDKNFNL